MAKGISADSRGKRAAPGRPRKFEFDDIVTAAEEVMEEEGFGTLTMRSLAKKLGIAHGNLYTYVGHIEDVEAAVLKRLLDRLPTPSHKPTAAVLRVEFIAFLHAARRALIQHPNIVMPVAGSAAWRSFGALTLRWVSALNAVEKDGYIAACGYSAALSYVALHAERERRNGPHYMIETIRSLQLAHADDPALTQIIRGLKLSSTDTIERSLEIVIDRLFPSLAGAARRRSRA